MLFTGLAGNSFGQTAGQQPQPEKIKELIDLLSDPQVKSWLEQNVKAAPQAAAETTASTPMLSTIIESIRGHIQNLLAAAPRLPAQFERTRIILLLEFKSKGLAGLFLLIFGFLAAGLGLDKLVRRLMRPYLSWMKSIPFDTPRGRLRSLGARALFGVIMILAFIIGSAGFFLIFEWPPLLRDIVLGFLSAAIVARVAAMMGRLILLPPSLGLSIADQIRPVQMTGERAQHWYRYLCWFAIVFAFVGTLFSLLKIFGFDDVSILVLAVPADLILLALALAAIWLRPPSPMPATSGKMAPTAVSWILTAFCIVLWILRTSGTMTAFWLLLAVVVLPATIVATHRMVYYYLRPPEPGAEGKPLPPVTIAVIDRGIRVILILAAAFLLAKAWGLEFNSMAMGEGTVERLLRGVLKAAVIILAADFGWALVKAVIGRKLGAPATMGAEHGVELDPRQARLRTLLPIVQNILFVILLVVAALMALSSVGIEIGPLIAGAGIAGVAIGFGAQTLVKDIISGMFYLLDDAFRVGEYIESGSYMGTVESFSLRSIKLRHHRGYLFTVPFGELGAVQNMSRDWAIEKFSITVTYDADIDKARKLVKKIGQDLAADPEFAKSFIEPLKMQGVQKFGDYGIELRMKMMTKPGEQFTIKRKAWVLIKQAFEANDIKLASPTIQVMGSTEQAAAAAQFAAQKLVPVPPAT
jgi:moderate conductance mechanosensitive channel